MLLKISLNLEGRQLLNWYDIRMKYAVFVIVIVTVSVIVIVIVMDDVVFFYFKNNFSAIFIFMLTYIPYNVYFIFFIIIYII